ncbi:DUF7180 family protein [Nitratidesulfovibrio liaohensis]|uniref:DUF7180 family protein n=1 Tax=Nitratidesulfovibrio liaohensis TaxID=2604158 RepID=UPI001299CA6F|nr:hypothetical protein [Nitratidesulfovibrio liaohensis]MRF64566.1 hypothetical protein [Staphylococcus epidermidis]NHZ46717.1 hypothetical protein [Nitratidesulfovibrio liaohensis]
MITINLSETDAAILKSIINSPTKDTRSFAVMRVAKEVCTQINNQQFDVSDFESSRQYESLSVNAAYLANWDKETKK